MHMDPHRPLVSVIVLCRNQDRFIARCLESVIAQTYPKEKLEVLVVDGKSEDASATIVHGYAQRYPFIRLVENPKRVTPAAMNIGIGNAKGDIIIILGAHSVYPPDYAEKCVSYLEQYGADNVGGIRRAMPANNTRTANAIALTFSSFFGVGNARYQTGAKEPRPVDTVFGGCYRKEIFKKIGLFNEKLVRSQDMELNIRLARAGGKIILVPDLVVSYFPKSTLKDFFVHNVKDGIWAILPLKYGAAPLKLRHFTPLLFVTTLLMSAVLTPWYPPLIFITLAVLALYLSAMSIASFAIVLREKRPALFPFLVAAFAVRHFGYGIGSLIGLVKPVAR